MEQRKYKKEERSYQLYELKLLVFILLAITISSCYFIESDVDSCINDLWERVNGSELPPSLPISIAVASNGDIWVGTSSSGIFLSTDNGDSWVKKNNGISANAIYSIAINPINGYIFAGSDKRRVFRTTDQGESWANVISDISVSDNGIADILISESGEIYFAAISDTLPHLSTDDFYYSNDNGDTWIKKSNTFYFPLIQSLALGRDGTLYAGSYSIYSRGVYRSTNGGDTWLPPSNYTDSQIYDLTVSDDGSIFAADINNGVLKSTDRGVTWKLCNTGIVTNGGGGDWGSDMGASAIMYNPITKDIFVANGFHYHRIYKSTNLGTRWEVTNGISISSEIMPNGFAFNPNTGQMYVLTYDGLYRSKDYPK